MLTHTNNPVRQPINDDPDFQPINRGYNAVFRLNRLSLGLMVPLDLGAKVSGCPSFLTWPSQHRVFHHMWFYSNPLHLVLDVLLALVLHVLLALVLLAFLVLVHLSSHL